MDCIRIRGARTHNLRGIDIDIPRNRLVVITGLSGSGKSSLAFDTLYAEGQRRYVESLSTYARQFLSVMDKPDADLIEGLSPAIAIEQKSASHNPRSTVGTVTEVHDFLRVLFARAGEPHCPEHGLPLAAQTISQMVDVVLAEPSGRRLMLVAPLVNERKGSHEAIFDGLRRQGFVRVVIDGSVHEIDALPALDPRRKHNVDVVIDRFKVRDDLRLRLTESFETAIRLGEGVARVVEADEPHALVSLHSALYACHLCGYSLRELEPRLFSFNSPAGACESCGGLGTVEAFDPARVVTDASLSLPGGALAGWDRRNAHYHQMLEGLARHYGFDLDLPFQALPERVREVLLHGSGDEAIEFSYGSGKSKRAESHPFEGIIPNLERRYRETASNLVREELGRYLGTRGCPDCEGTRLRPGARHVLIGGCSLPQLSRLSIGELRTFLQTLELSGQRASIAGRILNEVSQRLGFLVDVGLDYLSLERGADTLSGGEAQRIRLASQIGAGLVGVMYILDEPSIGLHQRDNARLLASLERLRDLGNSVIVVEHDEDAIRAADHIVDLGPGAGVHGGRVVAEGTADQVMQSPESLTGDYLARRREVGKVTARRQPDAARMLGIRGACGNNLADLDADIPVGLFTCVTGVSGSGKSTLIGDTLRAVALARLNGASTAPAPHRDVLGLEHFDRLVDIDQAPIGRTPRSNPATYTGIFTPIRDLFAATAEARSRGYTPGRFSFNVKGGRCEACEGDGVVRVEMHFLPDLYVACDVCQGRRYNRETLEITYKGESIADVLDMTVERARGFFDAVPMIAPRLQTLMDVGLGYVRVGQSATTLSGGEAQRVKLARELAKRDTGRTLYLLDEPTTGLHFHDVAQLLAVLQRLCDHGNTIVVVEHNLDVIRNADWIIDLGPEGGSGGGRLVVAGTPEQVAGCPASHTGRYLAPMLPSERAAC
jgi:excinuclease ABC subunit A